MRKTLLAIAVTASAFALVLGVSTTTEAQRAVTIDVYKSSTCGCCSLWVKHLQDNGFRTRVTETEELGAIKQKYGVPAKASSCHTAIVDGYAIEGHVPANEVKRLLKERPAVAGLAVPGMPVGSPGMEVGKTVQPYNVVSFDKAGALKVFASYGK